MFGKKPRVSPLESRKQLLIAESEINRAHLLREWQTMAEGVSSLADRAESLGTMASSTMTLLAGLVAFMGRRSAPATAKPSWLQKLSVAARLASTIWLMFRPLGSNSEK